MAEQSVLSEEPRLVARYGDVTANRNDSVFVYRKLNLVAFTDVQGPPDLIRQGKLGLRAEPRSGVGPRS